MRSTANPITGTFIAYHFRIEVREVLFLMVHLSSCATPEPATCTSSTGKRGRPSRLRRISGHVHTSHPGVFGAAGKRVMCGPEISGATPITGNPKAEHSAVKLTD